ncbi:MAG: BMP family ABC transporter substrate-binding protein, partial [Anaerolineae bacterium]
MKKWVFATLVALMALSLVVVGCAGTGGEGMKVGMVSDVGGIDDASFNENTWAGLERAQEELGVQAQFIESQAQADYEKNITEFAEQDYDLIFTVGFLLGDATGKMAGVYPDTNMAIIDFAYD